MDALLLARATTAGAPRPTTSPSRTSSASTSTSSCVTAVPGKYGHVPYDACNNYYTFYPNFAAAIAFAVIFGILTVAHLALAIGFKKWFCWVLIMGTAWECISFSIRADADHDQQSLNKIIINQLFFLLAPLWINASIYMTVGRMVHFWIPERAIWKIKGVSLSKYFVWCDIGSFLVQVIGGSMLSGNDDTSIKLGQKVYSGGIGLQELFVVLFTGYSIKFHLRMLDLEREGVVLPGARWRRLLYVMYFSLAMVTMRIIFRLIEFTGGFSQSNKLITNEGYQLGLDAGAMMLAILAVLIVHPGTVLKGPESEFPPWKIRRATKKAARKEKKATKKQEKVAKKEEKEAKKEEKRRMKAGEGALVEDVRREEGYEMTPKGSDNGHYSEQV